jgi:ABC-type polysaccharide/polyol phosphate transport system ATPase subunit
VIRLVAVAKAFGGERGEPTVVFRPTTITLPADRHLAILGGRNEGKTVLLQLLSLTEKPDAGQVITALRLSPVVNSDRIFHRNLSVFENIRFYARMSSVDEHTLMRGMNSILSLGPVLEHRIGSLTMRERRGLEAALAIALGFDCCMIDDIGMLAADIVQRALATAACRGAGVIFATDRARHVRQFADCAVVIQGQTLHPFARIEEAIRYYERE